MDAFLPAKKTLLSCGSHLNASRAGGAVIDAFGFQIVEIFEEQQPGGLLGIVEFRRAAGFFPKHIVDVLEDLFEHRANTVP